MDASRADAVDAAVGGVVGAREDAARVHRVEADEEVGMGRDVARGRGGAGGRRGARLLLPLVILLRGTTGEGTLSTEGLSAEGESGIKRRLLLTIVG